MDDTAMAFESPNVRAVATAGKDPLDRISVRDYEREIEIGAFQSERGVQQRIRFNVVLEVGRHNAAQDDDVDQVISYDSITEAIELQLSTERINLLETLAERVAERILEDKRAVRAFVRIEKLDRIPGTLGVEIVRSQKNLIETLREVEAPAQVDATPHPLVVLLANPVLHNAGLRDWLDAIADHELPAIICVEPAIEAAPKSAATMAQRRIDLLSIEQNAWVLAGKDQRCVVVDSRTELDWAMKHNQISVWAPSRIVLDAMETPESVEAGKLAAWLATEFLAHELVIIGSDMLPECEGVRVSAPASPQELIGE